MTDTTTAVEAARLASEDEASREATAQAAPDNPNPTTDDAGQRTDDTTAAPSSKPAPAEAGVGPLSSEATPLERITAADRSRADIAARFKEKRAATGGQVEFHGDMRDPSQTYGPLGLDQMSDVRGQMSDDLAQAQQQPSAEERTQAEQPAPLTSDIRHLTSDQRKLVKVKVHGREMFLPEDQVVAEAQKSLAAGNLLESAKEVLAGARGQMPDVRDQTESGHLTSDIRPLPSDPYVALAQTLQMESADAAASKLKHAIESETAKARQEAAREAARHVRVETELAVSQRALAAFEQAHPDVAVDEFARDAITTQVQREINADLHAVVRDGILKELPKTQDERNGLHTQLRAFGAPVRPIGDIFEAAGSKYATWRGAAPPAQKSEIRTRNSENPPSDFRVPTSPAAAPRVELSPDRTQRRAAIPTQPTNGTVPPRPAPSPELTTAGRRSAAIMAMRRARGQIVA